MWSLETQEGTGVTRYTGVPGGHWRHISTQGSLETQECPYGYCKCTLGLTHGVMAGGFSSCFCQRERMMGGSHRHKSLHQTPLQLYPALRLLTPTTS